MHDTQYMKPYLYMIIQGNLNTQYSIDIFMAQQQLFHPCGTAESYSCLSKTQKYTHREKPFY